MLQTDPDGVKEQSQQGVKGDQLRTMQTTEVWT